MKISGSVGMSKQTWCRLFYGPFKGLHCLYIIYTYCMVILHGHYFMVFLSTNVEIGRLLNHPTVLVWLD